MELCRKGSPDAMCHLLRLRGAVFKPGVCLPVLEVYGAQSTDDQLQLPLVKSLQQALRDQLVEAFLEGQELLLDPVHEPARMTGDNTRFLLDLIVLPVCDVELDVLLFVVLGDLENDNT